MDPIIPVSSGTETYDEPQDQGFNPPPPLQAYTPPARPGDFDYDPNALIRPNGHADGFLGQHVVYGLPKALWAYRDRGGEILFFNALYATSEGEVCTPWRFDGREWIARAPPAPRTLYGLEFLDPNPEARVLLLDAEASAEALRHLLSPKLQIVLAWYGGPSQEHTASLADLVGRAVTLWPTNTEAGRKAASTLAQVLAHRGNTSALIDTLGQPDGWSVAEAIQGGWGRSEVLKFGREHRREVPPDLTVNLSTGKSATPPPARAIVQTDSLVEKLPPFKTEMEMWAYFDLDLNAGKPWSNINNVERILRKHPDLWNRLHYDEFKSRVFVNEREWHEEKDGATLTLRLQRDLKLHRLTSGIVNEAVGAYAQTRARHPVKEWLESRPPWDDEQRLSHLCSKGFGSNDGLYEQQVGRCFLIGMIARIYQPGCQLDSLPVFEGKQGAGKTSALKVLAADWYTQNVEDIRNKDFMQNLSGYWLVEISELDSFHGANMERIKAVISDPNDVYRESYGRRSHAHPRQSVFAGTTNLDTWHHDDTGARRFWPVKCRDINLPWIKESRDQLFAEALHRYRAGEDWWKVPDADAKRAQDSVFSEDPWQPKIERFCALRVETTTDEILDQMEIEPKDRLPAMSHRVGKVMRRLGWEHPQKRCGDKVVRVYRKPAAPAPSSTAHIPPAPDPDEF